MEIPGYQIQSELGKGGMASVFLAMEEKFQRAVALKIMLPSLAVDESFTKRFLREARICAQLSHPHIVPVFDIGEHGGMHYLAMEYVSGGNLKQKLRDGISLPEAERVLREIASALDYASEMDYIHRDVKPDNIMFRQDGSAVLMDFGIARPTISDDQMTMMGTIVGTPKYMSPEQHRGKNVDPRADLYSLGVVFFQMITGKAPFEAEDPMAMGIKHISEPIPLLPMPLKRYQPLVRKLLAKDVDKRFQRGKEIIQALDELARQPAPAVEKAAFATSDATTPTANTGTVAKPRHAESDISGIKLESRMRTREVKEKAGLLSSSYLFDIYVMADDFKQFQQHFEKLTEELFAWGQQRGKKCGRILFKATVHPWIAGRVKDYVRSLRKSDSHAFMQRIPITMNLVGADGKPIEQFRIDPEEPAQEAKG